MIRWNKAPMEPLRNDRICSDNDIDSKNMEDSFMILKVTCWMKYKYKYLNGDNSKSVLKLKCLDEESEKVESCGYFGVGRSCRRLRLNWTKQFNFNYCKDQSFQATGKKGNQKAVFCCHRLMAFCLYIVIVRVDLVISFALITYRRITTFSL